MKKNGFTLIELLAVIVILAIIALIATPIVLNIIEHSKDSSKLNSANHYMDAVEQAIMKENMNSVNFIPQYCNIIDGNLSCYIDENNKDIIVKVEVDGEVPSSGIITFKESNINNIGLKYTNKYVKKNDDGVLVY